jgi:hypothetical protein
MPDYEDLIRQVEASRRQTAELHARVLANLDKSQAKFLKLQLENLYSLRRLLIELPQFEQGTSPGVPSRADALKQVTSDIAQLEEDAAKLG